MRCDRCRCNSTYRAPGIVRARNRAFSTWQTLSSTRWSTSVGTEIAGQTSLTSISKAIRTNADGRSGACRGEQQPLRPRVGALDLRRRRGWARRTPQGGRACPSFVGASRCGPRTPPRSPHPRASRPSSARFTSPPTSSSACVRSGRTRRRATTSARPRSVPMSAARRAADRVQDRADVVHALLQRPRLNAVGEPHARACRTG